MASLGFLVIRGMLATAEHVAPRLAGRAAFEIFCRTPSASSMSSREAKAVEAAAPFMAEARQHRLHGSAGCVMAYDFAPAQGRRGAKRVLVLHGWRSRSEHMKLVIAGLLAEGYRVIALDLPGHGRSSGRRLNLALAVEAAHLAAQWFGPFAAVVGHSFGGAVAVNAAAGSVRGIPPLETSRLVLISAPSSLPAIFSEFGRFLSLGTRTQTGLAAEVERVAGKPLETYVGALQLAEHKVPSLVVHAPDDKEVSPRDAEAFAGAGPHVRLRWAPGLGHRRILADRAVIDDVARFIACEGQSSGSSVS